MAKDITLCGLITVTFFQLFFMVVYCSHIKISQPYIKTGIYKFNNVVHFKKGLGHQTRDFHTLPTEIYKQAEHLGDFLWKKKTNIVNTNIEQGSQDALLRKLNSANNEHTPTSRKNNRVNYDPSPKENGKSILGINYKEPMLFASHNNLPQTRLKRSIRTEYGRTERHKRDIGGDTEVGIALGACVLGLLTAFLLICACIRYS